MFFINELLKLGINPKEYLNEVIKNANKNGYYDPIKFSKNPKYKISILTPPNNKIISFGSPINKDFIIYKLLEKMGEVEKGTAKKRQYAYLSRATKIKGNWKNNPYSKNNLAINILW